MWELRVVQQQNRTNAEQNTNIVSDMKKMSKGIAKIAKSVSRNPSGMRSMGEGLPNKTAELFLSWDTRITSDNVFYREMVISTY